MNRIHKLASAVALGVAGTTSAFADLPAGVTSSITSAGTDGVTVVGALAAAGAAIFLIAKVLKKFGISL